MGDLAVDTAVSGNDGRYTARVSPDWEVWGPNGGYIASIALRAAGAYTRFARPASLVGHYLGVAEFDTVDLTVTPLRSATRAESLRVSMTQHGKPIFEALVWAIGDVDGFRHDTTRMPEVPRPASLPSLEERLAVRGETEIMPFWNNLEERPIEWLDDWERREPADPRWLAWFRYRPTATFADLWVDACRALVLVDTMPWPSVHRIQIPGTDYVAPNIDIAIGFHRFAPGREWLLGRGEAPMAESGLIAGQAQVWADDGTLLASGITQLLCRPAPV